MKWYKQNSNEFDDPAHQELIAEFGPQAFGIYIGIRCFIAGRMTGNDTPKIEISERVLLYKFRVKRSTMQRVLNGYALAGLLAWTANSGKYQIEMPNLLSALDEWTQRSGVTRELLGKEEKRREKKEEGGRNMGSNSGVTREFNPPPPPIKKKEKTDMKTLLMNPLFSPLAEFQKELIVQTYPNEFLVERVQAFISSANARGIKTMRPQPILRMLAEDFEQFKKENNRKTREQTDRNKPAAPVECSPPPPEWNETKKKIKRSAA